MPEIHKFEAMLKWAKHFVKRQGYTDKFDAKVDFRNCMDRLSRDLKLYRISPQDLIKELFKHSQHQTNYLLSLVKTSNGVRETGQWPPTTLWEGKQRVDLRLET